MRGCGRLCRTRRFTKVIEIVLKESGYGNYAAAMPAGARRRANLRMLVEKAIAYENTSYKGIVSFCALHR